MNDSSSNFEKYVIMKENGKLSAIYNYYVYFIANNSLHKIF